VSSPERAKYYFGPSGLDCLILMCRPGATRFALAPGYHIPRLWRCGHVPRLGITLALNHAGALSVTDRLQACVDVEFCEDVFDVVVDGCRTDVELIGDRSRAVTFRQTFQDFNFS
jgi:hypothetical protein